MAKQAESKLRVGIIGVGGIGNVHLKAFEAVTDAEVVAICDIRPERLEEMAAEYEIADSYDDYEDLLARKDIDAVSICTPNDLHAPITIAALKAGKHVLCEKPLTTSMSEALAMTNAAKAAKKALVVAFSHRRRGDVQWLKQAVGDGLFGDLYYAKAMWMRRSGIPSWGAWFIDKTRAGGGPLIDLGVHMLDMSLYLLGEPRVLSVSASTYSELGPQGKGYFYPPTHGQEFTVEDLASAFIRLEGGKTLTLEASWATYGKYNDAFGVSLFGTKGGAELEIVDYTDKDTLRVFTDIGGAPVEMQPAPTVGHGHTSVAREFTDLILNGDPTSQAGLDGVRRAQVIQAIYQSALEGREIAIEDLASLL
ncbi:MAG: Gfo/Idh/MocA family oxidoreductase [Anaerolineae bacterium]